MFPEADKSFAWTLSPEDRASLEQEYDDIKEMRNSARARRVINFNHRHRSSSIAVFKNWRTLDLQPCNIRQTGLKCDSEVLQL